jgi:hypothetical protein
MRHDHIFPNTNLPTINDHPPILFYAMETLQSRHHLTQKLMSYFVVSGLLGFWTLAIVCYSRKHKRTQHFQKLYMFLSLGEGWETPSLLGPLDRANLHHWLALSNGPNRVGVSHPRPEDGNKSHHQNPLESIMLFVRVSQCK